MSLALALDLPLGVEPKLDPRDDRVDWIDPTFRVAWNTTTNELRAAVRN
jgi:hypothetical protein